MIRNPSSRSIATVRRAVSADAPVYVVRRTPVAPALAGDWAQAPWVHAETLDIAEFHPKSTNHRPVTRARMLYDKTTLYVAFRVSDRYVRCTHTELQSRVSRDSCVEFFVQPLAGKGYFNFEINCGGTPLVYFIEDASRVRDALFKKYTVIPENDLKKLTILPSLPRTLPDEIVEPTEWSLGLRVPFDFMEPYLGPLADPVNQSWRANFFKCAEHCSHPHWASWASIGEKLSFHQPARFGHLRFDADHS